MSNKHFALWLSALCIIIFIIQLIIPNFTDLFLLSQDAPLEIWRFLTSIFLHADIAHLAYNLFALIIFGSVLESLIGSKKFLFVFLSTGIFANLISINFYSSSLGASGAIFGIIGTLILVRPTLVVWAFGLPMPIFIAGILWTVIDSIGIISPSNVANIAHLSGMFLGLVIGIFFRDWKNKKEIKKINYKVNENEMRNWEDVYMR